MEKLSRRSFFRLFGGGVAAAVIAPKLLLDKIIDIPVEYGWTWYVDKTKLPGGPQSSFAELITKTLRENSHKISENVSKNNALLVKLKSGEKAQLRITKISPEEQTKRMSDRLNANLANRHERHGNTMYGKQAEAATFYESYEDLEKKYLEKPYGLSIPHIRAV